MNAPTEARSIARAAKFSLAARSDHHRIVHLQLDTDTLKQFLVDVSSIDVQNLEYVPYMRFHLADKLVERFGDDFASTLIRLVHDRTHGGFTTGVQDVTRDPDDFVRLGTAVGHILGPSNHDSMSGTFYARFNVKHTDTSDSYLRQAYRLFTMHTDGTFVSEATDWLLMMKLEEREAKGGESRFLHLDDWEELEKFRQHPLGSLPFNYRAPGSKNVSESINRPVFFESKFGLSMSFIDQFVQPKNREEAEYLRALSESMELSRGTREVTLPAGDLVVLNNFFYVHGRAPFEKNETLHRELMRQRGSFAV